MLVFNLIPWVVCYFVNVLGPLLFMLGLTVPAYLGALLYSDKFRQLEENFAEQQENRIEDSGEGKIEDGSEDKLEAGNEGKIDDGSEDI